MPWRSLQKQLGCDYSNPRHFKAAAKVAIRKVQVVFPGFRVDEYLDEQGGGLIVKRGTTSGGLAEGNDRPPDGPTTGIRTLKR